MCRCPCFFILSEQQSPIKVSLITLSHPPVIFSISREDFHLAKIDAVETFLKKQKLNFNPRLDVELEQRNKIGNII